MHTVDEREAKQLGAFQAVRENPKALERLAEHGIRNFLLASGDGLLIDAVTASKTLDLDEVAAHAATALNSIRNKTDDLTLGRMKGVVVEFSSGESVLLDPMGHDAMAVYLAESPDGLAQLARELPHIADVAKAGYEFLKAEAPLKAAPQRTSPRAAPASNGSESAVKHVSSENGFIPTAHVPAPDVAAYEAVEAQDTVAVREPVAAHKGAVSHQTVQAREAPAASRRVILRRADLETAGFTATAIVELVLGDRHSVGRAVGRNVPDQYLSLAAEATIRAVTEFLPTGYAVVLQNIQPVSSATEVAVWANIMFISPKDEQLLPGIARLESQPTLAAAKTVLSAINRRLELALIASQQA